MTLTVTTRRLDPDIDVVDLAGRITLGRDNANLETTVVGLLTTGSKKVIVNLSEVHYVDSSGVGSLALTHSKATQSGARLVAAGAQGMVLDVFHLTRVDMLVPFYPDIAEAVASFRS